MPLSQAIWYSLLHVLLFRELLRIRKCAHTKCGHQMPTKSLDKNISVRKCVKNSKFLVKFNWDYELLSPGTLMSNAIFMISRVSIPLWASFWYVLKTVRAHLCYCLGRILLMVFINAPFARVLKICFSIKVYWCINDRCSAHVILWGNYCVLSIAYRYIFENKLFRHHSDIQMTFPLAIWHLSPTHS